MTTLKVIAEAGQCRGSWSEARDAVEAAAEAGCWGVKIQLLQPERIARADAALYWDETRIEITDQRAAFETVGCLPYDAGQLGDLVAFAHYRGVALGASVFDGDALGLAIDARLDFLKIASGDITHRPLIEAATSAFPGKVILSTGASRRGEVLRAIDWARPDRLLAVLACPLAYPSDPGIAEIGRVPTLAKLRGEDRWEVGYSDHTRGTDAAFVAVGAGATVLEKHFTLDPYDEDVPDNAFALDPEAMALYVAKARTATLMLGSGSLLPSPDEEPARIGARRSLVLTRSVAAGEEIPPGGLVALRPADPDGFEPWQLDTIAGSRARVPLEAGAVVRQSDLTP